MFWPFYLLTKNKVKHTNSRKRYTNPNAFKLLEEGYIITLYDKDRNKYQLRNDGGILIFLSPHNESNLLLTKENLSGCFKQIIKNRG